MRYVSIDLETTGLNPNQNSIIEVGMVVDDLVEWKQRPVFELPSFSTLVDPGEVFGAQVGACAMNSNIFAEIVEHKAQGNTADYYNLTNLMWLFLQAYFELNKEGIISINAAGKNFAGFDRRFLENVPNFTKRINVRHRVIDPGSMYLLPTDEKVPHTNECIARSNIPTEMMEDSHRALPDARTVCRLIRSKIFGADAVL